MTKWARRLLGLAALLVVSVALVLAVLVFVVVPRPDFQAWAGARLSRALGPNVDFDSVSLVFWPEPGIQLDSVRLGPDRSEAATFGSVSCTLLPGPLLNGVFEIDGVALVEPILSVSRDAEGRWSFGGGLEHLAPVPSSKQDASQPTRFVQPREIAIHDGVIELTDRGVKGGPVQLKVREIDAEIVLPRADEAGSVRLSLVGTSNEWLKVTATLGPLESGASVRDLRFEADVRGGSLASDRELLYLLFGLPIRNPGGHFDIAGTVSGRVGGAIKGSARIDLSEGSVEGWGIRMGTPMYLEAGFDVVNRKFAMRGAHLEAATSGFDVYDAEHTVAEFEWVDSELHVTRLDFGYHGGTGEANGRVDFDGPPKFSAEIRLAGVDFRELSAARTHAPVEDGYEHLDASASIHGQWPEEGAWQRSLRGDGRLQLTGGSLASSSVMRGVYGATLGKIPGFGGSSSKKRSTSLEKLAASFSLDDGRANTSDLENVTSDYRMQGKGSVGLVDGDLRLDTQVKLTANGIKSLYVLAATPFRKRGDHSLPPVPVKISGTLEKPRVSPDMTGISLSPFRAIVGGTGNALGRLVGLGRRSKDSEAAPEETPPAAEPDATGSGADANSTAP